MTMMGLLVGVTLLLISILIRAFGLQAIVWAIAAWVRLYTCGLPDDVRERRRREIESDVFEQRQDDAQVGYRPDEIAARLLFRWLCGIPSDVSWRLDQQQNSRRATIDVPVLSLEYALSRPFSISLAFVGLLVLLPLVAIIAFSIWLEDRGPIFVREQRIGRGGVPFWLIKFRTNPGTGIGLALRATTLHALPALLNVIRGDMNFVGPKPLSLSPGVGGESRYHHIVDVPNFHVRTAVRPGMTGLAQVYAPADIGPDKQFKYDALYARRTSLWLDLRLIAISLFITITWRWSRRGRHAWQHSYAKGRDS